LRNTTIREETDQGEIIGYEEMGQGTLQAVAKYRKRNDYQPDLSTDPPTESSREANFSYSVSAPINIQALGSEDSEEFIFDFTNDPIPAGITDLYLQVIFKGTLGKEQDTAIAVGMKDINEPMHVCSWNSTDRVYLEGHLYTANQIRQNSTLLNKLPPGFNIDPYDDLITGSAFYLDVEPEYYHTYNTLFPSGRYNRVIILTDAPSFNMNVTYEYGDEFTWATDVLPGVTNQGPVGAFVNTQVFTFRGVTAHYWYVLPIYYPDGDGIESASWPPPVSLAPLATEVYP
jgi:hypothetical protein